MTRSAVRPESASAKSAVQPSTQKVQPAKIAEVATVLPADAPTVSTNRSDATRWSSVDLGPELPMSVFTSTERWNAERIGAVAIYCSDGRWGEAFDEFCHRNLQLPRYDRLAMAGGPACFAPRTERAKLCCQAALDHLDFLVKVHELKRIVLITHYGCAAYAEQLHQEPDECLPSQLADLRAVGETLQRRYETVKVDGFLAMRRGLTISFHAPAS